MTTVNADKNSTLSQLAAMLSRIYQSTAASAQAAAEQNNDTTTTSASSSTKTPPQVYNRDFVSGGASMSGDSMFILLGNQASGAPQEPLSAEFSDWFNSADTDANGALSEAEFVAARPDKVTEEEATALFAKLDTESAGSITEQQLFEELMAYAPPPSTGDSSEAIAEKFSSMDTDGDGKVSKAEFVAARPEGATEAQSEELFNQIDSEGTGGITEEQFADALSSARGAPLQ